MDDQTAPERIWADLDHWLSHPPDNFDGNPGEYAAYIRPDVARDELQAAVAEALERAASVKMTELVDSDTNPTGQTVPLPPYRIADRIRALITPDQSAALGRVKAEAEKRGMERAIEIISAIPGESEAIAAIRAEAEGEKP